MLDFRMLETFMWVANLRSFRRAADKLHTTQPAVSHRIAQLESRLGVRLLDRDRRTVSLTAKGRDLLSYVERLTRLRAEMIASVGDASAMRGTVQLGVAESIVHTWLPALLEEVNATYPNLALEIEVDISPNLRERLIARDLNLAFMLGPIDNPKLQGERLCSYPLAFVACQRIRFAEKLVPLQALARWPIITFARHTRPHAVLRDLFASLGPPPTIHASASLATVIRMALDGIGIAVIPPAIIANTLADGRLRLVRTAVTLPPLDFRVCWPASHDSLPARKIADIALRIAADFERQGGGRGRPRRRRDKKNASKVIPKDDWT
jgi:DNA-binding transcriptional LysR family regulator